MSEYGKTNPELTERLQILRLNTTPIFDPEQAIDTTLSGGGTRKIVGSVQDFFESARIFASNYDYNETLYRKALTQGLSSLHVAAEYVNEQQLTEALTILGTSAEDMVAASAKAKDDIPKFVETLLSSDNPLAQQKALQFLEGGGDAVGKAAVRTAGEVAGEILGYQTAFGINANLIGFEKFATQLKLSPYGDEVPDLIVAANGFVQGLARAQDKLGGSPIDFRRKCEIRSNT